ncbi:MAG: hypothetical protein WB660_03455 [Candidatus Sulfotelmatobacter sp.]
MGLKHVPRCQHMKVNGTQCGSPALRCKSRCYFHEGVRIEQAKFVADKFAQDSFELPALEDANSVQLGLMKVIHWLGHGRMDPKMAGLMLYALQTASINLRSAKFEAEKPTDVVIDRDTVDRTSIGGPQWFEQDFHEDVDDEVESEDEAEDEADEEDAVGGELVAAEAGTEEAGKSEVKHVSAEGARMQVQGLVRNWLLETAREKAAARSG